MPIQVDVIKAFADRFLLFKLQKIAAENSVLQNFDFNH